LGIPVSDHALTTWLFGKLPAHGDFVARGLSMHERNLLDNWLTSEMVHAQTKLGDAFTDCYDHAPPWCFIRKQASAEWAGGAMCPSMDSAGRRFPILLARAQLKAEEAVSAARSCIDMIYVAFEESMTAEALISAAARLEPGIIAGDIDECWWVEDAEHEPLLRLEGQLPDGLITAMLEGAIQ
jgi:type VI secretion system protein ImpM